MNDPKVTKRLAPAYFTARNGRNFARGSLINIAVRYGRSGFVSVCDWNGDRVKGRGAGGGGYDKTGVVVAQALTALAGPAAMVWLAKTYGRNTGSGDNRGGLYGLSWHIVDARGKYSQAATDKYRERSAKAPARLPKGFAIEAGIDGACGIESVRKIALALGLIWTRCNAGKHVDTYTFHRVRADLETYAYEDGRTATYLRERIEP